MPPKRAPKKGGQKSPPKSAFNSPGKFGSPIKVGKKDNRNVLDFEGVDKGVMNAYVKKHNAEEEAFMSYDMRLLNDNPGIIEELGINAILSRKGVDGETAMKQSATSTYFPRFLNSLRRRNSTYISYQRFLQDLSQDLSQILL